MDNITTPCSDTPTPTTLSRKPSFDFSKETVSAIDSRRTRRRKRRRNNNNNNNNNSKKIKVEIKTSKSSSGSSSSSSEDEVSVEEKITALQRIVPGGETLGADKLFEETADYILALQFQVKALKFLTTFIEDSHKEKRKLGG